MLIETDHISWAGLFRGRFQINPSRQLAPHPSALRKICSEYILRFWPCSPRFLPGSDHWCWHNRVTKVVLAAKYLPYFNDGRLREAFCLGSCTTQSIISVNPCSLVCSQVRCVVRRVSLVSSSWTHWFCCKLATIETAFSQAMQYWLNPRLLEV